VTGGVRDGRGGRRRDHRDPAPHRAHRIYPLMQAPLAMGVCSVLLGFTLGSVQLMVMSLLLQLAPSSHMATRWPCA
jgi:hypothetical protein